MAECVGCWLNENGIQQGARCALFADNSPRWVASYLGTLSAGCVAVPLDTAFRADQVSKLLKDSGASVLFTQVRHLAVAQQAVAGLPVKLVLVDNTIENANAIGAPPAAPVPGPGSAQPFPDLDSMFAAGSSDFIPIAAKEDDVVVLLYTSGTTSDPKGVTLTHTNLMGEVNAVFGCIALNEEDAILGILPLFHALAQMANLLLPLVKGARVVYLETLNTTELLRALRERGITAFCVVPQFFYLIHEKIFKEIGKRGRLAQSGLRILMNLNRVTRKLGVNLGRMFFGPIHATFGDQMRYLVTGGSRFDPAIGRDFHALGIDVLQAYGLTETSGGAVVTPPNANVIGSVGRALPGVELKILEGQPQEEGGPAIGEIAIRGPIVMKGYWNRPEATAAVFRDDWFLSGDLGYVDKSGNLFITGRKKEMIVLASGKNIYPEEIEAHYLKSPFIKEICVMGLASAPGEPSSERLHAVVVPNFEVLKERKIVNSKEVIRWDIEGFSAQLPSTKRILSYDIWQDELPRTTTRKIKRFEVERRVKQQPAGGGAGVAARKAETELTTEDALWLEQADVQRALKIVREAAKSEIEQLRPGDNLELDLGLDSMQRIGLLVALEEELGGKVEESRMVEIYTVRELVDAVQASAGTGARTARPQFAGWSSLLASDPTDPEVLAVSHRRPGSVPFWYFLGRLVEVLARDRFSLKVTGLHNLPQQGPFLICPNHQSYMDPIMVSAVLPWRTFRDLFSVGTSEIFGSGFMRWLARQLRVVVVDPDANLVPAMRAGAYGLRQGMVLMIYPEGERSIDGVPKRFRKGAAILALHLKAPIVPVAMEGFYDAWPRGKFFQKFTPLGLSFGTPLYPPPGEPNEQMYDQLTAELKARVVEMWEKLRAEMQA
jgi:long-chain acyl-CoA synthetase